ncbi:MAG: hypothetical protein HKN43_07825 [Rhodothermales bacterium]|nr:hypothetical protein [Rhodothermales bacterium]
MPSFKLGSTYPWTHYFLEKELPSLSSYNRDAHDLLCAFTGLNAKRNRAAKAVALKFGIEPVIDVQPIGIYGYTPPTGQIIQLGKTFLSEFESAMATLKNGAEPHIPKTYTPTILESNLFMLLEATILHELVHYFRRKFLDDAKLNLRSNSGRGREEAVAQQFEKKVYGMVCDVQNLSLSKHLPNTLALSR